jgi:hypothetical protein
MSRVDARFDGWSDEMAHLASKPLLLLDVDGVFNPFAFRPGVVPPGFTEHTLDGYRVLLNPRHGEWLAPFAMRFEFAWATTWEHRANDLIAPLVGLPTDLPVIAFGEAERRGDWKLPAVTAFVGDRPLAWIDDDLGRDAEGWARARAVPTILLRADPAVGLARRHIKALERFADRLSASRLEHS